MTDGFKDPEFLSNGFIIPPPIEQAGFIWPGRRYLRFLVTEALRRGIEPLDLFKLKRSGRSWVQYLEHEICRSLWADERAKREPGQRGPGKTRRSNNWTPQKQLDRQRANYEWNKLLNGLNKEKMK